MRLKIMGGRGLDNTLQVLLLHNSCQAIRNDRSRMYECCLYRRLVDCFVYYCQECSTDDIKARLQHCSTEIIIEPYYCTMSISNKYLCQTQIIISFGAARRNDSGSEGRAARKCSTSLYNSAVDAL